MTPQGKDASVGAAAAKALELVEDGARIGLGTGRAASAFVVLLGARVRAGLRVSGVPTSKATANLAREVGVPVIELDDRPLDLTVDGADEVAPNLDMIKGWGGALVRERIVATASLRQVIMVGPEKLVRSLGERGRVPVEVLTGAVARVRERMVAMGLVPTLRTLADGKPFVSDNGNHTVDFALGAPLHDDDAARELERRLLAMDGVVDTGLFLGTAERVLVGYPDGHVEVLRRAEAGRPAPKGSQR